VTGLSSALGMLTTAEGVETIGQLDQLRSEGCNEVQGYLFSKPLPAHELGSLLAKFNCRDTAA
jgi:EAL domain-containing protein (putative c-di-GMP-specific phosphodiesterase class I)